MSKKEQVEQFDAVLAERNSYSAAMHDMVNGKFSSPIRLNTKNYGDQSKFGSRYTMRISFRAMPLFLVVFKCAGQPDQTTVLTEQQITDQRDSRVPYVRMLNAGVAMLLSRQYREAQV